MGSRKTRFLFVINSRSGNGRTDLQSVIENFFSEQADEIDFFSLEENCDIEDLKAIIQKTSPEMVIAAGGDGTVKLLAELLIGTSIVLGILPAGSANGMAREFNIPNQLTEALKIINHHERKEIHALRINGELSIHLADIGINAHIVHRFQKMGQRGMIGYARAAWQALKRNKRIRVRIRAGDKDWQRKAHMVVIANGTTYGTGVKINKTGNLYDNAFEVVILKWFSIIELIKMLISFRVSFDKFKTEVIHTSEVTLELKTKSYFQVDGEGRGKVNHIEAVLDPNRLTVAVPSEGKSSKNRKADT